MSASGFPAHESVRLPRARRPTCSNTRYASSTVADIVLAELTDEQLAELAERLRPFLSTADMLAPTWLNAKQAADYLACSRDRLYDLVQLGKLDPRRDGRRLVFRRADLDAYLARM